MRVFASLALTHGRGSTGGPSARNRTDHSRTKWSSRSPRFQVEKAKVPRVKANVLKVPHFKGSQGRIEIDLRSRHSIFAQRGAPQRRGKRA